MGVWQQLQSALRQRLRQDAPPRWNQDLLGEAELRHIEARRKRISRLVEQMEDEVRMLKREQGLDD